MDPVERESAGVLVVRIWRDGESRFRARVTVGVGEDLEGRTFLATSPDEVLGLVRSWMAEFSTHSSAS